MNVETLHTLARAVSNDPSFLLRAERVVLRDLLLQYSAGLLDEADAAEVRQLINDDPDAAAVWAEYEASDAYLATPEGNAKQEEAKEACKALAREFTNKKVIRLAGPSKMAATSGGLPEIRGNIFVVGETGLRLQLIATEEPEAQLAVLDREGNLYKSTAGWLFIPEKAPAIAIDNGFASIPVELLKSNFTLQTAPGVILQPQLISSYRG